MDDFNLNTIQESRAEWCEQFILIVKPYIMDGFDDIFNESVKLCRSRNQSDKYLITFQNMICQIPKWSQTTIEREVNRIIEKSHCSYLEVILTTVHIAQLKILSAIRAGQKQKKVDIEIPSLLEFIHKVYINVGREIHKNAYLYVINSEKFPVSGLQIKKNRHQIEGLIKEGILETFRKTIPIDKIIKAYLEPSEEEEIYVKTEEQYIYNTPSEQNSNNISILPSTATINEEISSTTLPTNTIIDDKSNIEIPLETDLLMHDINKLPENMIDTTDSNILLPNSDEQNKKQLSFNDIDSVHENNGNNIISIDAPKNIERLEEISQLRKNEQSNNQISDDFINVSDEHIPSNFSLPELYDEDI